jgi:hypothetical protein
MNRLAISSAVFFYVFTLTVVGQSPFGGNWSTDPVPKGWAGWSDSGSPNTFTSQPSILEPRKPKPSQPNEFPTEVFITLKEDGSKVSGYLGVNSVWDLPMKMELAAMGGKTIRFMTIRPVAGRDPLYWLWIVELKDDNTMLIYRHNIDVEKGGPVPVALPPSSTRWANNASLTLHRVN